MVVPPARLWGNLAGSVAVLAVAAALAVGLPMADRAVPAERPLPAGQRYVVGAGVSLLPPPGASLDVTKTRPRVDRGTALFVLGPVRYAVVVEPFAGTLADAEDRLRRKIIGARGYQVTGRERPVTTEAGLGGLQGGYTAPGRVGRYWVFLITGRVVTTGRVVEVTFSATAADPRAAFALAEASTRSLAYAP